MPPREIQAIAVTRSIVSLTQDAYPTATIENLYNLKKNGGFLVIMAPTPGDWGNAIVVEAARS